MIDAMQNWTGKSEYYQTGRSVWQTNGRTAGYLKSVKNLRLFAMRNAGHMVPRSQPEFSLDMFTSFIKCASQWNGGTIKYYFSIDKKVFRCYLQIK